MTRLQCSTHILTHIHHRSTVDITPTLSAINDATCERSCAQTGDESLRHSSLHDYDQHCSARLSSARLSSAQLSSTHGKRSRAIQHPNTQLHTHSLPDHTTQAGTRRHKRKKTPVICCQRQKLEHGRFTALPGPDIDSNRPQRSHASLDPAAHGQQASPTISTHAQPQSLPSHPCTDSPTGDPTPGPDAQRASTAGPHGRELGPHFGEISFVLEVDHQTAKTQFKVGSTFPHRSSPLSGPAASFLLGSLCWVLLV